MAEITTPTPPAHLPKPLQLKWVKTYQGALVTAKQDNPELPADRHRALALRSANKLTKVEEPQSYEEAKALVDARLNETEDGWKVIAHGTRKIDGKDHLSIVTANGKRHVYPVPADVTDPAPAADDKGSKKSSK